MSENTGSLSAFMRGGQYLAHIANMIMQNITRGLAVCLVIGFITASFFYVKTLDGYDKYIISIEISATIKDVLPIGKEQYKTHVVQIISPDGPNQQKLDVLLKERRLVPWYEFERAQTLGKIKSAFWLTFFDSILILIALSLLSSNLGRIITKDKQTRGARMVTKRELIREVRSFNKEEAKKLNMQHYKPYKIEEVEYPLRSETQHTLLAGTTGAGKTQLLLRLLIQINERNDRAIIYDKMRSFVPMFYNPETDHILNPLDDRCPPWDIFADATNIVEWNSIADSIIKSDNENDYWTQGAKSIFANTANRLQQQLRLEKKKPTMTDLLYLLTQSSVEDLHNFLEGTEAARHINPTADKQAASMLSTLAQSITCLGFLKDATDENPGFSIRKWMADDTIKGKLFLTSRDDQHATIQPLLTMWMSLCTTSLMSQERSNDRLCWFIIDELPSLNKLPDLEDGLAQARQYGGAYVLGIQLESQLQETYDEKGAQTIMGLTLNKAIFNPGDPSTAKAMADAIGKIELIRRNEGISLGANRIRDGVSMNSQITQEHIVLPEDLMNLQNLNFFLKMRGSMPCAPIEMKFMEIQKHHEGYIKDMHFMTRYDHKMSSATSADAAKQIIAHIRATKSPEPKPPAKVMEHQTAMPAEQPRRPNAEQNRPYDMSLDSSNYEKQSQPKFKTNGHGMTITNALTGKPVEEISAEKEMTPYIISRNGTHIDDNEPSMDFLNDMVTNDEPDLGESKIEYHITEAQSPPTQIKETDNGQQEEPEEVSANDFFTLSDDILDEDDSSLQDSDEHSREGEARQIRKSTKQVIEEKAEIAIAEDKISTAPSKAQAAKAADSSRVQTGSHPKAPSDKNSQMPPGIWGSHSNDGREGR